MADSLLRPAVATAFPAASGDPVRDLDASVDGDLDGEELIEEEILLQEISIDGMCGVY